METEETDEDGMVRELTAESIEVEEGGMEYEKGTCGMEEDDDLEWEGVGEEEDFGEEEGFGEEEEEGDVECEEDTG